jgi:hypothetical protein
MIRGFCFDDQILLLARDSFFFDGQQPNHHQLTTSLCPVREVLVVEQTNYVFLLCFGILFTATNWHHPAQAKHDLSHVEWTGLRRF